MENVQHKNITTRNGEGSIVPRGGSAQYPGRWMSTVFGMRIPFFVDATDAESSCKEMKERKKQSLHESGNRFAYQP
jgi:hypothetical protein